MRLGVTTKFNIKYYYKRVGVIYLIMAACLFAINAFCWAFATKYSVNMSSGGTYEGCTLWMILFAAKELYDLNYKVSVANCISRKTVIVQTLAGWALFSAVLAGLTILCEYLTSLLFEGSKYMTYQFSPFFSMLDANVSGALKYLCIFGFQTLLFILMGYVVLMFCALTSKLPGYGITIMWTAAFIAFIAVSAYIDRIVAFLADKISIDIGTAKGLTVILAVFTAAAVLVYIPVFRRVTYLKADSK